ncbi:type 2 isopentenyl-diphosphate Delta-isomerase [Paenibacillus sp. FJAT-26967]|uniref:type 2 isopentenyl-diphosphate Delta-isomerase n=1 Tax=Paenibacillus sp. FJAT-26967 TaxID=1729690 RepID=UPI000839B0CE|nr:type 2 isopentenyl-diphosphate Delta-isomerase [Paenibacillus sp. FJAT-26967]
MRSSRKMDHVHYALQTGQSGNQGLSDVKLVPNCLPDASTESVALYTTIGELKLSSPIVVNAMTGGADETEAINRELAVAARECGLAMAVGSQMSAIRDPRNESSYKVVRQMNPGGLVFANLGSEANVEQAERAVNMLQADAFQIHLNVMQELIMPEGDRNFHGMLGRIQRIVEALQVPVIVKEVGFGIPRENAAALREAGVQILDVGGSGGTNFAAIENARRQVPLSWLNEWGMPTGITLLEALQVFPKGSVMATGGIRTSEDIVKALVLGASAAGIAGLLLKVLQEEGTAALIERIDELHEGVRLMMTALGANRIEELWKRPVVITGSMAQWCGARGIDLTEYGTGRK